RCRGVLAVDGVIDLLAVDGHFLGRDDAQPPLVTADLDARHGDFVVDDDTFVFFPGQYQHRRVSFSKSKWPIMEGLIYTHETRPGGNSKATGPRPMGADEYRFVR